MIMPTIIYIKPVTDVIEKEPLSNTTDFDSTFSDLLVQLCTEINPQASINGENLQELCVNTGEGTNVQSKNYSHYENILTANIMEEGSDGNSNTQTINNLPTKQASNLGQNKNLFLPETQQPLHNNDSEIVQIPKPVQLQRMPVVVQAIRVHEAQVYQNSMQVNNYANLSNVDAAVLSIELSEAIQFITHNLKEYKIIEKLSFNFESRETDRLNEVSLRESGKPDINNVDKLKFGDLQISNNSHEKKTEPTRMSSEKGDGVSNEPGEGESIIPPKVENNLVINPKSNLPNSLNIQAQFSIQSSMKNRAEINQQIPLSALTKQDSDNIIKNIVLNLKPESSELRMKLQPESLGEIYLKVRVEESKATVKILVTQITVKAVIETNLPQLREALIARGVDVQQIDVQTSGNPSTYSNHKKQDDLQGESAKYNAQFKETETSMKMFGYNTVDYLI